MRQNCMILRKICLKNIYAIICYTNYIRLRLTVMSMKTLIAIQEVLNHWVVVNEINEVKNKYKTFGN